MKTFTEKEISEILALHTLYDSDNAEIVDFAMSTLLTMPMIGVEIKVDDEIVIDERVLDDDSIIAEYIVAYDEYIARRIDSTEDCTIKIEVINLFTGKIIFSAYYEMRNKGEVIATSERCSRKSLREIA